MKNRNKVRRVLLLSILLLAANSCSNWMRKTQRIVENRATLSSSVKSGNKQEQKANVLALEGLVKDRADLDLIKSWAMKNKDFSHANLRGMTVRRGNMEGVIFNYSNLSSSVFIGTGVQHSSLVGANLTQAYYSHVSFIKSNLESANLTEVNLTVADFTQTNLVNANFSRANLNKIDFSMANLSGADFSMAHFDRVVFLGANLSNVKGFTAEQFEASDTSPIFCNTKLPKQFESKSNRDCDRAANALLLIQPDGLSAWVNDIDEARERIFLGRKQKW
jgi:uncharacterized protein YjbI with pentapeptide repeats